jgi:signal transduction histidine kinase
VVLAAEMAVTTAPLLAAGIVAVSEALVLSAGTWTGLVGTSLFVWAVLLGLVGGWVVRWYIRALAAEQDNQQAAREQALLAQRQRIAREVHDVVAHSLSITLLHLTGARRALQQDRDVDEAVAALTEAERVGRAAMADVRHTVSLLNETSAGTRPLPGAADIAELVDRTRSAGLDVRYTQEGELSQVGAAAGLGLYRIAQESLANIVKHAPSARAELTLRTDPVGARLTVRNNLPAGNSRGAGAGLPGMSARAAQLGAELRVGADGTHWVVDVVVPAGQVES